MATKNKNRRKLAAGGLAQQAQRALEKGNCKQALKDAKVCYRQQPNPETRQLLERAYLARGRDLYRAGLRVECRAVVEGLLELKVTDASVRDGLPQLLIALGLFDRVAPVVGQIASLEQDHSLLATAADHAVLRPKEVPASLPDIRTQATAVRQALAALEAGQEAEAAAILKDIPRGSPLADWKYFARGLAAYYRQDAAEMEANWQRLEPGRMAARIAGPLKALTGAATPSPNGRQALSLPGQLEKEVLGGPVLTCLERLQEDVAAGRWRQAVRRLRGAATLLSELDAALPQRVGMVLYENLARQGLPSVLSELARIVPPPPLDPQWNRGMALAWERANGNRYDEDPAVAAERHWRAYLDDLTSLSCLSPEERSLAQALVWLRLGRMLVEESCPLCSTCGVRHDPDEAIQARAEQCLRKSLKLAPELRAAYQALADAYGQWQEPDKAAATFRRLVDRFPEDLDGLLFLAGHYLAHDKPEEAREFILRAQRLKPLDRKIKAKVWATHLESARQHALAGRWDQGRAEFAAAEKLDAAETERYELLVQQAALEFRAGQLGAANHLLDRARAELGEEAPTYLAMAIQGVRYGLPKLVSDEFEHRWLTAMKKRRNSRAAGLMCRIASAHLDAGPRHPRRKNYLKRILTFLEKCSRTKWQPADLCEVLTFLLLHEHEEQSREDRRIGESGLSSRLLDDLVPKARAAFSDWAFFQYVAGDREFRKGPQDCNRPLARDCFQRALELAEKGDVRGGLDLVKLAKKNLLTLDEFDGIFATAGPALLDEPEDDEEDERPDGPEEDGGPKTLPVGNLSGNLLEQFVQVCRKLGLDPEKVLDRAAQGMPFRLPGTGDFFGPRKRD